MASQLARGFLAEQDLERFVRDFGAPIADSLYAGHITPPRGHAPHAPRRSAD